MSFQRKGLRLLIIGFAVVASLGTSFIGAHEAYALPAVADCGARYQEDCDPDSMDDQESSGVQLYPTPTTQELQESRLQRARDAWADEHLAAEKAVATWWRGRGPQYDPVSGQRGRGILVEQVPSDREIVSYECDPNYGDAESGGCVPGDRAYDCVELRSWGIASIPIVGEDWMVLDDDGDGRGCEPTFVPIQVVQAVAPTPDSSMQCDGVLSRIGCFLFGP